MSLIQEAWESLRDQKGNFVVLRCGHMIWADPRENEIARAARIEDHYRRDCRSRVR